MAPLSMTWVVGDFETASACDLKQCGAWRYAEDPTTEILCFAFAREGANEPSVWTPDMAEDDLTTVSLRALAEDERAMWIAHNTGFEKAIWRRIMVDLYGWPDIPNSRWHDTMASCANKVLPLDLDRAALVLRLPFQKDSVGSALTRGLSKPRKDGSYDRSPETLRRVQEYCAQDIRAETALHERVGWLPTGERSVWLLDQRINERGVRLDLEFVHRAQEIVDKASVPLAAEFASLTQGLKVTQRDKVLAWVRGQGVEIPNMTKETLAEMLGADDEEEEEIDHDEDETVDLPDHVHRVLSIRRLIGSASIKKLRRMELCVGSDGRARGLLQYHGAGPGRWAGRLLQPQNFPRGTVKANIEELVAAIKTGDPEYVEMLYGPPVEAVVSSLRNAIVADEGRALTVGDFSTVEARIVLALAGQRDKIDLIVGGQDIYNDMGAQIYGRPINRKGADLVEGHVSKGAVLGLGFQMGAPKFKWTVKKNTGLDLELDFCKKVVGAYREDWAPLVPKVWYALEKAAISTVWERTPHSAYGVEYRLEDLWLSARLPSGRKLWYFNPQPVRRAMPWDETDIRRGFTYQAMKLGQWRTIDAYGGLLTENAVQALARDLMVSAMFKCERENLPVVLTVHDEIVTEPEQRYADPKVLEQIMCDAPAWAVELGIPVAAECWTGERYRK